MLFHFQVKKYCKYLEKRKGGGLWYVSLCIHELKHTHTYTEGCPRPMQRRPHVWASKAGSQIWTLRGIDFLKLFLFGGTWSQSFLLPAQQLHPFYFVDDGHSSPTTRKSWLIFKTSLKPFFYGFIKIGGFLVSYYTLWFPYFGSALSIGFPTFNLKCGSPKHPLPQMPNPWGVFFRSSI